MGAQSKARDAATSSNPFVGRPDPPGPADVRQALGRSIAAWDLLRAHIAEQFGDVTEEWAMPAKKYGWSLRLKVGKRTILHLGPRPRHFMVAVVLGEKAVAAVRKSDLAPEVIAMVEQAPRYPEGRGIRFEIRSRKELGVPEALARIKMAN